MTIYQFTNTRRISTRIFGSTARRLFGGGGSISSPISSPTSTSPAPSPLSGGAPSSSTSPINNPATSGSLPPHRRLAEFTTVLGDYKLATTIWDVLRKENIVYSPSGRAYSNGSDVLPLLIASGPAVTANAVTALGYLGFAGGGGGNGAAAQLRALAYAVRWEVGVSGFHSEESRGGVEGERWLVAAAGTVSFVLPKYESDVKGC